MPPFCGFAAAISAKLRAVTSAISPFRANARMAEGPLTANATPARARMPPPTIAPIPIPVAPVRPMVRMEFNDGDVLLKVIADTVW